MHSVILVAFLGLAAVSAVPVGRPAGPLITIVRSENLQNPGDGSYKYSYETSDGTKVEQSGAQKQIGKEQGIAVQGSYSFAEGGRPYTLTYKADENGYQPQADFLPEHFQQELHPEVAKALTLLFQIAAQQRADASAGRASKF